MTAKIDTFANSVDDNKGLILGLKSDLKNGLLNKIDQVATGAADRNIDFSVDSSITNEINKLKTGSANTVQVVIGKHIYPKTETLTVTANTSGG